MLWIWNTSKSHRLVLRFKFCYFSHVNFANKYALFWHNVYTHNWFRCNLHAITVILSKHTIQCNYCHFLILEHLYHPKAKTHTRLLSISIPNLHPHLFEITSLFSVFMVLPFYLLSLSMTFSRCIRIVICISTYFPFKPIIFHCIFISIYLKLFYNLSCDILVAEEYAVYFPAIVSSLNLLLIQINFYSFNLFLVI